MTLLERANDIIKNIGNVSDTPEGSGIHPNDFNAVVKEWQEDYAEENYLPEGFMDCQRCGGTYLEY
ncbi:hypothetical protein LCGC14_2274520 [marine sediment metagenome]|uniref:Uncharacterized protein n=1 Tax=marine sediment metagenome TaxID=412755 RepID=A0A0F9FR24_9ZZZZ